MGSRRSLSFSGCVEQGGEVLAAGQPKAVLEVVLAQLVGMALPVLT